jgi:aminopeptidase N
MKMFGQLRVNYDEQNWLMLVKSLVYNYKSLNVNDRVQIIDDAFYLANNQKMPISYALNILEYIPREDNFLPWKYVIKSVKKIINLIEDDSQVYSKFRVNI